VGEDLGLALIGGFSVQPASGWIPGVKAFQSGMALNSALARMDCRAGAWPPFTHVMLFSLM